MTEQSASKLLADVRSLCSHDPATSGLTLTLGMGMDVTDIESCFEILVEDSSGYKEWITILSSAWVKHLLVEVDSSTILHRQVFCPGGSIALVQHITPETVCESVRSLRCTAEPTPDRELSR